MFGLQHITAQEREIRSPREPIAKEALEAAVDLNRDDARPGLKQQLGQRAGSRPNLQYDVVRARVRRGNQLFHQVEVDEEVLAELMARRQPRRFEQFPYFALSLACHPCRVSSRRLNAATSLRAAISRQAIRRR